MREYKSGMKWAFWRWTFTPSGYITRLHLVKTPWGALMVHFLNSPDPEPHYHDHPVTFLSIIIRGWYTEMRRINLDPRGKCVNRGWFNYIRATVLDAHRIIQVAPRTITFCFVGPKTREWGFHTPEGWIGWREYNKKYKETA